MRSRDRTASRPDRYLQDWKIARPCLRPRLPTQMTKPTRPGKNRFLRIFLRAYYRFVKIHGRPREIALGFSLGIFIAMSPFMGLHMATNPLTIPVIYSTTWFIGSKITGVTLTKSLPQTLSVNDGLAFLLKTPAILATFTLGGIIVGIPVAVIGYYVAFGLVQKYQKGVREKLIVRKARRKMQKSELDQ